MLDFDVGGHRLRVISISQTGAMNLDDYNDGDERLVMLVPVELMFDDGAVLHHSFEIALGRGGLLASLRANDLPALALDLSMPADVAADWLRASNVTVAVLDAPTELVAAVVLAAATGVGEALEAVRKLSPEALVTPEEEITVSVCKDHMVLRQDLQRRRFEHVARGGSPWEIR